MTTQPDKPALLGVSVRDLAHELALTDRRIRQLRDDGVLAELPDGSFDRAEARAAYAALTGSSADREAFLDATDALRVEVEAGIGSLSDADPARKAALAEALGPKVGRLVGRLQACPNFAPAGSRRAFERDAVAGMGAGIVIAFLAAAGLQLVDDDADA